MDISELIYKARGIDPRVKKAYQALFNGAQNKAQSKKVISDLIVKFKYYGAAPTVDPIQLAKNAAYREVIEYILTMAARISDDTLEDIQQFINDN